MPIDAQATKRESSMVLVMPAEACLRAAEACQQRQRRCQSSTCQPLTLLPTTGASC